MLTVDAAMQVFQSEPLNSKHWCYVLTENRLFQHIISVWTSLNEFCVYAILPLATAISEGESIIQEALSQADNPHYSTVTCTAGTAMLLSTFIRNSWVACIWFEDVKFQMLTRSNSIFMLYLSEQFLLLFMLLFHKSLPWSGWFLHECQDSDFTCCYCEFLVMCDRPSWPPISVLVRIVFYCKRLTLILLLHNYAVLTFWNLPHFYFVHFCSVTLWQLISAFKSGGGFAVRESSNIQPYHWLLADLLLSDLCKQHMFICLVF